MQPVVDAATSSQKSKEKNSRTTYIFFEFECTQNTLLQCDRGYSSGKDGKCKHCQKSWCESFGDKPNLSVVQKYANCALMNCSRQNLPVSSVAGMNECSKVLRQRTTSASGYSLRKTFGLQSSVVILKGMTATLFFSIFMTTLFFQM